MVFLIKGGKIAKPIEDVYFDMLVEVIDCHVEKTADYEKRVRAEYSLSM